MPYQPKRPFEAQFFGPALIGACLAVVLSVPVAAYVAAIIGDTYEVRATVYGLFIGWAFIGAVCILLEHSALSKKHHFRPHSSLVCFCLAMALSAVGRKDETLKLAEHISNAKTEMP